VARSTTKGDPGDPRQTTRTQDCPGRCWAPGLSLALLSSPGLYWGFLGSPVLPCAPLDLVSNLWPQVGLLRGIIVPYKAWYGHDEPLHCQWSLGGPRGHPEWPWRTQEDLGEPQTQRDPGGPRKIQVGLRSLHGIMMPYRAVYGHDKPLHCPWSSRAPRKTQGDTEGCRKTQGAFRGAQEDPEAPKMESRKSQDDS
jgi:hypothetical protein